MIAKLKGLVDSVADDSLVVDVGGVGYLVYASARTLRRLPAPGGAVQLLVVTHVREDRIDLFGFADAAERAWFTRLLGVQGVGTRVALALLSALAPEELLRAVMAQDPVLLTRADGVGRKLAQRIVSELKDRLGMLAAGEAVAGPGMAGSASAPGGAPAGTAADDAISALVNLGYGRADAFSAVGRVRGRLGDGAGLEDLIKGGLAELGT